MYIVDKFHPNENVPQPLQIDSEYLLYKIKITDGSELYLRILGNGGDPKDFPILKDAPEVFGWESTLGMLMLITNDPISPRILIKAIDSDPLQTITIVSDPKDMTDVTHEFLKQYR